jgi:hypothetical protein
VPRLRSSTSTVVKGIAVDKCKECGKKEIFMGADENLICGECLLKRVKFE